MTNWGRVFRVTIAFGVLVALHYSLRPLLGWRAEADFLVVALLLAAVRLRPGGAALLGLIMGITAGSMNPPTLGATALSLTAVGFGASWLKAVFFADNLALNGFFFFLGKLVADIVRIIAAHQVGGTALAVELLWSLLSAAVTALAGVIMLVLLRPLLEAPKA